MKFLNTTFIRQLFFSAICLLVFVTSKAQSLTDSPYSRYGIGMLQSPRSNSNFGSGGIGIAWRPSIYKPQINDSLARSNAKLNDRRTNFINIINPASFSNISLVTFDVGIYSNNVQYSSNGQERTGNNTSISHIALAFPVGTKIGVGFGLRPFSAVGYDYETTQSINTGINATNKFQGEGGLSEFFLGGSYSFDNGLSLGAAMKYRFGRIQHINRVVFDGENSNNFFNTINRERSVISSLGTELGLQYDVDLGDNYLLHLGVIYSPIDQLSSKYSLLLANYTGRRRS